ICGKDPRQYALDYGLWTRQITAELIKQRMKIELSVTTVGRILDELNITPQKPLLYWFSVNWTIPAPE
ncbi:MAG: winged helix-turn-helix domain-containing protein, partial [Sedimentisphaerales bacterium]